MGERGWSAIVLAGERPGETGLAAANGAAAKALIRVAGEPMLARVVRTLLASPSVARVIVLAQQPDRLAAALPPDERIATAVSGGGIAASIAEIAGTASAPWPVLVATADHPLLTREMVEAFLAGAGDADAAAAVVERRVVEAEWPETRRTWLRFSDGAYTGANLFALTGDAARRGLDLWAGVEKDRKKALRLLASFGPMLAMRTFTRTISLDEAIAAASRKAGLRARAVRLPFAEAAIDVDKPEDLALAERILLARPR